mmetsp:Transcript_18624/g.23641  ORF Transcript_18624/g.23641 Transcript_18624/m.23641 type:complete len:83 (-) Transcript_18624:578-826(-)
MLFDKIGMTDYGTFNGVTENSEHSALVLRRGQQFVCDVVKMWRHEDISKARIGEVEIRGALDTEGLGEVHIDIGSIFDVVDS